MKNYLISILFTGEDLGRRKLVQAKSDEELWEKLYLYMAGYGNLKDSIESLKHNYEEEWGEEFDISVPAIKELIYRNEDILEFIFDCDTLTMLWEFESD